MEHPPIVVESTWRLTWDRFLTLACYSMSLSATFYLLHVICTTDFEPLLNRAMEAFFVVLYWPTFITRIAGTSKLPRLSEAVILITLCLMSAGQSALRLSCNPIVLNRLASLYFTLAMKYLQDSGSPSPSLSSMLPSSSSPLSLSTLMPFDGTIPLLVADSPSVTTPTVSELCAYIAYRSLSAVVSYTLAPVRPDDTEETLAERIRLSKEFLSLFRIVIIVKETTKIIALLVSYLGW